MIVYLARLMKRLETKRVELGIEPIGYSVRVTRSKLMEERINKALDYAICDGGIYGDHHKAWVIDQMVRALTGCPMVETQAIDCNGNPYTYQCQGESTEYIKFVAEARAGEDGPETYEWNIGIAP